MKSSLPEVRPTAIEARDRLKWIDQKPARRRKRLLTVTAIMLGVLLSIPLGVLGALRRGGKLDHFLTFLSVAGVAVPQCAVGGIQLVTQHVNLRVDAPHSIGNAGCGENFGHRGQNGQSVGCFSSRSISGSRSTSDIEHPAISIDVA